jgi:peptidoglycan DL-endopeptidase CwlO
MSRRPLFAIAVAVASVLSPLARSATADSTSDQQKLVKIAAQLTQMEEQASLLDEQFLQAQSEANQAKADVAATEAKIVELQQQLTVTQSHVSELALQQFANGGTVGGLGTLLGDRSTATYSLERDQATKTAFADGQDSIDQLGAGVDELNKQKAALARQQAVARKNTALALARQDDLANRTAALIKLQSDTSAQFGADKLAEAVAAQQAALEAKQAAQAKADAASAAAQAAKDKAAADSAAAAKAAADRAAAAAIASAARPASNRGAPNPTLPAGPQAGVAPSAGKAVGPSGQSGGADGQPSRSGSQAGGAGGQSGASTNPPATPTPQPVAAPPPPASGAAAAVRAAIGQLGVPYVFATSSPGHSFDCSGLTMYAWAQAGVSLPHSARAQYAMLPHVSQADVQPGDLLFFYSPIHHVAMYIGNGQMVEAPATGLTVRTRAVNWSTVVGIGRP